MTSQVNIPEHSLTVFIAEYGEMLRNIHPATRAATCRQGAGPPEARFLTQAAPTLSPLARFSDKFCPRHRNNPDKHRPGRGGLPLFTHMCRQITTLLLGTEPREREKYEANASTLTAGREIR